MDELYVLARRVLLDALEALGTHRRATVLVGAQAIYLRIGEGDLAVAPYTTDGDIALDPEFLPRSPPLEEGLSAAGFVRRSADSVGEWITARTQRDGSPVHVAVDLLTAPSVTPGRGRRAARFPGHHSHAVRIVRGLDGVFIDKDLIAVGSLEEEDRRSSRIWVAGPGALLVAKLHKVKERQGHPRQRDKDALDVFRLLRGTDTPDLAERMRRTLAAPVSRRATGEALGWLAELFGHPGGEGISMLLRALGTLAPPAEISASCQALTSDLLRTLGRKEH